MRLEFFNEDLMVHISTSVNKVYPEPKFFLALQQVQQPSMGWFKLQGCRGFLLRVTASYYDRTELISLNWYPLPVIIFLLMWLFIWVHGFSIVLLTFKLLYICTAFCLPSPIKKLVWIVIVTNTDWSICIRSVSFNLKFAVWFDGRWN